MRTSRREFIRMSTLGTALGWSHLHRSGAQAGASGFKDLRRGVGTFSGQGGTIGWLVNPDGALVVDSQFPDSARQCLEGLKQKTSPPLEALINSHHHGDHVGGNGVFKEAVRRIVAHRNVPELQRMQAAQRNIEAEQTYPDSLLDEEWDIEIGSERVRARHYGSAHTGGDVVIFFEQANVVHMGDLVFNRLYPFIDRPGGASIAGWIQLLESVERDTSQDTLFVFGHGQPAFGVIGGRADVKQQRDFLEALLEYTRKGIEAGKSRDELAGVEHLPGFENYVAPIDWITLAAAVGVAFEELSAGS